MTPERIDYHLDAVLRASGSGLRHFSFELTKNKMREALKAAMAEAVAEVPAPVASGEGT